MFGLPHALPSIERALFTATRNDVASVVYVKSNRVVIKAPPIGNRRHRISFKLYSSRNGMIYAVLVHYLRQNAIETAQPIGPVVVVINGIGFNSEGEMINVAGN
jgi:hypothetical protein